MTDKTIIIASGRMSGIRYLKQQLARSESLRKELEEKQHIQINKMQQRYEDLLGFDISELEDLSQKDKKILDNSTIKSLFNENKQLKNKLDITYSYLTEMIKGEKLFTDKDYLFRAKLVLQKIKNLETKQCKNCKHYYTDYDCLHDYCNIKDKEVSIKDSCENWER